MTCPLKQVEIEILQKIADGHVLKQIAHDAGISEAAVSNRMERARERVGAGNSTLVFVATALRCGWIH